MSTCYGVGKFDENFRPVRNSAVMHETDEDLDVLLWCSACEREADIALAKANLVHQAKVLADLGVHHLTILSVAIQGMVGTK